MRFRGFQAGLQNVLKIIMLIFSHEVMTIKKNKLVESLKLYILLWLIKLTIFCGDIIRAGHDRQFTHAIFMTTLDPSQLSKYTISNIFPKETYYICIFTWLVRSRLACNPNLATDLNPAQTAFSRLADPDILNTSD